MKRSGGANQVAMRSAPSTPSNSEVRSQLLHMLDSTSFRPSQRRREMLQFLVEEALAGRGDRLKGVTVAIAVFGRDENFDQQSDPVVRLEARRLRSDLDSYYVDAGSQDPIRITIPKGGYVPHFAWQSDDAFERSLPKQAFQETAVDGADPDTQSPAEADTGARRRHGRLILAAALLAVVGLLAAGGAVFWPRSADPDPMQARTPAIIVLPFEAFGDVDDIRLIASGVTEALIANLMRFPDFRLYSATTSFRQGESADPALLGRDLGVSFVVAGALQSENGQAQLRARLVDARTGEVRWSGGYDTPLTPGHLLEAQKDLAIAISTELGETYGAVNGAIVRSLAGKTAPSMPSYTCILRAYDYRRSFDETLFEPAINCLERAILRDPDYADAWAMLGWLRLDAARMEIVPEPERPAVMAAALDAASRAVGIDPGNQRAQSALAAITFYKGDYAKAEILQREVLALNPHDPDILAQTGWRMAVRGDREGLEYLEQAVARSANPPGWYSHLIAVYAYLDGDYARALAAAEKSSKAGSAVGLSLAAMSAAKLGDKETARAELAAMAESWPLLGRDPAAAYRMHHATDEIVEGLVEGLREAGWRPPDEVSQ